MTESESSGRRVRRGRQRKAERKASASQESSKLAQQVSLQLVGATQAAMIHDAVKKILWDVGVIIEHRETRNQLVRECGCHEDAAGYIHLTPDLVESSIASAPRSIQLYDHDGNVRVDTSSKTPSYCPGHNCVRILDFRSNELRPCSLEDIRETAKLCEALPNIDMVCSLGYPSEVPPQCMKTAANRPRYWRMTTSSRNVC